MSDKSTLKKVCSRCGKGKHIDCFHKETRGLYGVRKICKECRQYLAKNKLSEKIEKQQKECFNYKNLQPLWAQDNLKKGAKIIVP